MTRSTLALLCTSLACALLPPSLAANDPDSFPPPNGAACRDNVPPLQPLELDTTFAGDGRLELVISEYAYTGGGFLEANGEALLFGYSAPGQPGGNPSNGEGIMQRLGIDGSVGAITRFDASSFGCSVPRNFLTALRLQNGDYAAGGYVQSGCGGIPRFFNVLRLRPDGVRLDEFDQVPFSNQLAYVFALAEQTDGKIVASGLISQSGSDSSTYDFGVARFDLDGDLDPTFGTGGTFVFDLDGALDYSTGLVIDRNGRILVGGFGTSATDNRDVLLLGLTSAGVLDTNFGNGGIFRWDRAGFNYSGSDLALADDRILISGSSRPNENTQEMTVLGVTLDGQLDTGFSGDGVATIPLAVDIAGASFVTVGPRGRIYVTGSGEFGGSGLPFRDAVVAVLRSDGTPDRAFNNGEPVIFSFGELPTDLPVDVERDPEGGRILVTGYTESEDRNERRFGAVRLVGLQGGIFCDGIEEEAL